MTRIERLAAILLLLQESPRTSGEIARLLEISRRTVLRDVQALSEMGIPVIAREGPGGGYSLPESYRFDPLPLNRSETFLMLLALRNLERYSDLPFRKEMASLSAKLRASLPGEERLDAERLLSVVGEEQPVPQRPAPYLEALLAAAREQRWVAARYRSSERESVVHILPLKVYAEENHWYVRAYSQERGEVRTYRADRFVALGDPEEGFVPGDVPAATRYDDPAHPLLVARFSTRGAARAEIHRDLASRMVPLPDGGAELSMRFPPDDLPYYARLMAGFGEEVQVLEPAALRAMMRELGEYFLRIYS